MDTPTMTLITTLAMCVATLWPHVARTESFSCRSGDTGCLIASIAKSNANGPGHDYIWLEAGTYRINRVDNSDPEGNNGLPIITGATTIVGEGQGVTNVMRDPQGPLLRLWHIAPTGGLTLAFITTQYGAVDIRFFQRGGCVLNTGSFMAYHSTIRDCTAWVGGGIDGKGEQTYIGLTLVENYADLVGGGCTSIGRTRMDSSWIGNNIAWGEAGCAVDPKAPVTVHRTVFYQNFAHSGDGGGLGGLGLIDITSSLWLENVSGKHCGGIELMNGRLTMINSTAWDNKALHDGGGLCVFNGSANLKKVAFLYNKADVSGSGIGEGGAIKVGDNAEVTLAESWLLFNESARESECAGNVTLESWNVIGTPNRFHRSGQPACED
jgi:hypothetical protein